MKVLLFSNYDAAFLECITYQGLIKNIGQRNVKLFKPDGIALHSSMQRYGKRENLVLEAEVMDRIDEFDDIIFFNGSYYHPTFEKVIQKSEAKNLFMDGNDDFFVRRIYNHPKIAHYLKSDIIGGVGIRYSMEWSIRYSYEMLKASRRREAKLKRASSWEAPVGIAINKKWAITSFPLTAIDTGKKQKSMRKDVDLSFVGALNVPDRRKYYRKLLQLRAKYDRQNFYLSNSKVGFDEYVRLLKRSKVSLSMRGVSPDAWRYWEIPYYSSALLAQRTSLLIPNNFVDEESALFFSDTASLENKFERYVVRSDDWKDIETKGRKHFMRHHTPEMRVKNLLMEHLK